MELLDLPPEIFRRVVAHLVSDVGISSAWKYRTVCRTFRRCIEFEILANQPTRAFSSFERLSFSILRANMALYLTYRICSEKGAYSLIPRFMKKVCDTVCSGLAEDDHQTRRLYARTLCQLFVSTRTDAFNLLRVRAPQITPRLESVARHFTLPDSSNQIAAATAVGNLQSLREALGDDPDDLWKISPAFGSPLVAATTGNHYIVVSAIIKHLEHNQHLSTVRSREPQLRSAIDAALEGRHPHIALLLFQVYHVYNILIFPDSTRSWVQKAMKLNDGKLFQQVLALETDMNVRSFFRSACRDEDLDVQFVKKKVKVVEELLTLGASPNGWNFSCYYDRPLSLAMHLKELEIVQALLRHGADPNLVLRIRGRSRAYWNPRSAIETLLDEATEKHDCYVDPVVPRVQVAIGAPDL